MKLLYRTPPLRTIHKLITKIGATTNGYDVHDIHPADNYNWLRGTSAFADHQHDLNRRMRRCGVCDEECEEQELVDEFYQCVLCSLFFHTGCRWRSELGPGESICAHCTLGTSEEPESSSDASEASQEIEDDDDLEDDDQNDTSQSEVHENAECI